jgi:transposase-like protein
MSKNHQNPMSPKKLTEEIKQEILKLYRETDETSSTLAERFGVSSSTISRFLKNTLSESEYEELVQQKRLGRTSKSNHQLELKIEESPRSSTFLSVTKSSPIRSIPKVELFEEEEEEEEEDQSVDVVALGEMLGEDLADLEDEDEDLEDEEDEDWEEDELDSAYPASLTANVKVQVLPLSAASFPKTCYLVIDKSAELITRPLKEFADLGTISGEEIQQKTLPVFDNHRVARRFSNRFQRVIKVPDGQILKKTCSYLKDKGITRLLMDGQIYSLL